MKKQATPANLRQQRLKLDPGPRSAPVAILWGVAVLLLAIATYFFGLDSLQIPKNGDEFP